MIRQLFKSRRSRRRRCRLAHDERTVAYVADALGMGPRLARLPITESGCAGGVVGLARAADFLAARPDSAVLLLALEFSSLTFQRWDRSATNVVSTAIFGDGGAAVILAGPDHPRARQGGFARFVAADSVFFPGTTHLMGFHLRNQGLQIVLDRGLAPFVRREVQPVVESFLKRHQLKREDIARWVMHPGGRRIIEVMAERLDLAAGDLQPTEDVLAEHGNMWPSGSSASPSPWMIDLGGPIAERSCSTWA